MPCQFSSFDELWQRYLTGEGPSGAYMAGLSADRREALRRVIRQNVLGDGPDGPFTLTAKSMGGAWNRALRSRAKSAFVFNLGKVNLFRLTNCIPTPVTT